MITRELEKILSEERSKGSSDMYIRNALKEFLQVYVLYYVYTSKEYSKNLLFTGGTCLRHFFNLPRLSEDLDLDYLENFDSKDLMDGISDYFKSRLSFDQVRASLKQRGEQIILKFPVLKSLGIARGQESDLLYVKLDLSVNPSKYFDLEVTSKSIYGFNFVARHYDISSLMAGKIHAIITRSRFTGSDSRKTVKGRDFFDLLWFLKLPVKPNLKRLSDMLGEDINIQEVKMKLDMKVKELMEKHKSDFRSDLIPLISETDFIWIYVENYFAEYSRYAENILV
jgi:predicted nucleotidyltransferase component of viral defense system